MMPLAKLTIKPEAGSELDEIEVQFNPNSYSIGKTVAWGGTFGDNINKDVTIRDRNAPEIEFEGGQTRSLSLDLLFDTTEEIDANKDVRKLTNKIVKLTRINRQLGRPPICTVSWGESPPAGSDFPFTGVVTQLTQNFSLFLANGTPVRANLVINFMEWLDAEGDKKQNDPELTTRLIKRGDTLSNIAGQVYRDPKQWRVIADANRLDDPRRIQVGKRLDIPKSS